MIEANQKRNKYGSEKKDDDRMTVSNKPKMESITIANDRRNTR